MDDPWVRLDAGEADDDLSQAWMEQFRLQGLLAGERQVIEHMDRNVAESGLSAVITAAVSRRQVIGVLPEEAFEQVLRYSRWLITRIGEAIASGAADIRPVRTSSQAACTWCAYRSVCQFDPTLPENRYTYRNKLNQEEALRYMREQLGESGD
jgi:ATP-dependent helicase/nuclease subunit B